MQFFLGADVQPAPTHSRGRKNTLISSRHRLQTTSSETPGRCQAARVERSPIGRLLSTGGRYIIGPSVCPNPIVSPMNGNKPQLCICQVTCRSLPRRPATFPGRLSRWLPYLTSSWFGQDGTRRHTGAACRHQRARREEPTATPQR